MTSRDTQHTPGPEADTRHRCMALSSMRRLQVYHKTPNTLTVRALSGPGYLVLRWRLANIVPMPVTTLEEARQVAADWEALPLNYIKTEEAPS